MCPGSAASDWRLRAQPSSAWVATTNPSNGLGGLVVIPGNWAEIRVDDDTVEGAAFALHARLALATSGHKRGASSKVSLASSSRPELLHAI